MAQVLRERVAIEDVAADFSNGSVAGKGAVANAIEGVHHGVVYGVRERQRHIPVPV